MTLRSAWLMLGFDSARVGDGLVSENSYIYS